MHACPFLPQIFARREGESEAPGHGGNRKKRLGIFELMIISGVVTGALSLRKKCAVVPFRSRQATGAVLDGSQCKG
jgi:hypothetical protein